MHHLRAHSIAIAVLACGCGDEVVGAFEGGTTNGPTTVATFSPDTEASTFADGSGDVGSTTAAASTDGSGEATTSGAGDSAFVPPGCFGDDFDNDVIDALWNTWQEGDAELVEAAGVLKLRPPTTGVLDTGIVGAFDHVFPFSDSTVRIHVVTPPNPAQPELLFLTVHDDVRSISIELSGDSIVTDASEGEMSIYHEAFPTAPFPAWIGLRAEGTLVHFEVSDDGVTYSEVAQADMLGDLAVASTLVMAQTYADNPTPTTMMIDDLEVCAN